MARTRKIGFTKTPLAAYDAIEVGLKRAQELGLTRPLDISVHLTLALSDAGFAITKTRKPRQEG